MLILTAPIGQHELQIIAGQESILLYLDRQVGVDGLVVCVSSFVVEFMGVVTLRTAKQEQYELVLTILVLQSRLGEKTFKF